jgi:hypothetical protein
VTMGKKGDRHDKGALASTDRRVGVGVGFGSGRRQSRGCHDIAAIPSIGGQ